jgi:hypothetical protein
MSVSQRAMSGRPPRREPQQPDYLAFAKVNGGWFKLGAAWKTTFRNNSDGLSLQFGTLPLNWDGRFILAVPNQGEPGADEE